MLSVPVQTGTATVQETNHCFILLVAFFLLMKANTQHTQDQSFLCKQMGSLSLQRYGHSQTHTVDKDV